MAKRISSCDSQALQQRLLPLMLQLQPPPQLETRSFRSRMLARVFEAENYERKDRDFVFSAEVKKRRKNCEKWRQMIVGFAAFVAVVFDAVVALIAVVVGRNFRLFLSARVRLPSR